MVKPLYQDHWNGIFIMANTHYTMRPVRWLKVGRALLARWSTHTMRRFHGMPGNCHHSQLHCCSNDNMELLSNVFLTVSSVLCATNMDGLVKINETYPSLHLSRPQTSRHIDMHTTAVCITLIMSLSDTHWEAVDCAKENSQWQKAVAPCHEAVLNKLHLHTLPCDF